MSDLQRRLGRLEALYTPGAEAPKIRTFLCTGEADDDGCPMAEWIPPTNTPPAAVVYVSLCICTGVDGLAYCRYRDGVRPGWAE